MTEFSYKVGDLVSYVPGWGRREEGPYKISRLLPSDSAEQAYRLTAVTDLRERVAQAYELRPVPLK